MERFKAFMISFFVTMLGLLAFGLIAVGISNSSKFLTSSPVLKENGFVYTPSEKDNMTIMTVLGDGETFILSKFDARKGKILVFTLKGEEELSLDGERQAISEIYLKKGMGALLKATNQSLNIDYDNSAKISKKEMQEFIKILGDIRFKFPSGEERALKADDFFSDFESDLISKMWAEVSNRVLEILASGKGESFVPKILDSFESDISYYDFEARKRALEFVFCLNKTPSIAVLSKEGAKTFN